jgi:Leucine-rich repeat (LRR) protein
MSNEHVLDLSGRDFPACPSISNPKTNLQRLCLSHNKIRKITGLPETLVALDISNNQMTDLQIDLLENLE